MPRLPEQERNDRNKDTYDYLQKTRGSVRGGFAIMMVNPDVTQRMAHVGTYVRFECPLPANIKELAATVISAEMENPAEYTPHGKNCRDLKVTEAVVKAALERAPLTEGTEDEKLIVNFTRELARNHKLNDATFEAAKKRFGVEGTVDLIAAVGYYAMLAVCHTALEIKPRT
jgi:4-carboxymuconolactone decarboxylase